MLGDVGWMIGNDMRTRNQPSRSGMPRRHVLEDYTVINEIGRRLNMRMLTPLVLGEWDKDNLLRNATGASWLRDKWDRSPYYDAAECEKIVEYVNGADYIEPCIHGLLHDCFHIGQNIGGQAYFFPEGMVKGGRLHLAPEGYLREHFDMFMELYKSRRFTYPIRSFVSPGGPSDSWTTQRLAGILKDYDSTGATTASGNASFKTVSS